MTADDVIVELYLDGVRITALPHYAQWDVPDTVVIPRNTRVIAVMVKNGNPPGIGGLLASDSLGTILTDSSWKVSSAYSSGWMTLAFDDSSWNNASVVYCNDNGISGISKDACWIWSSSRDDSYVYLRLDLL